MTKVISFPADRVNVAALLAPAFAQMAEQLGRPVTAAEREALLVGYYRGGISGAIKARDRIQDAEVAR
jgi:hypothetical protein